jgi:hypothetical protein
MHRQNGIGASPASQDDEGAEEQGKEGRATSPYDEQDDDWFVQGRYLKIFARGDKDSDEEIHQKEFILLDSKNTEGTGVRVDHLKKLPSGWIRKYVAVVGPETSISSDDKAHSASGSRSSDDGGRLQVSQAGSTQIALEWIGCDNKGLQDCYARLDHTYNIPFAKYKCQDLGILSKESLAVLRLRYITYLTNEWDLVTQVRESFKDTSSTPTTSLIGPSPSASTAASLNISGGIPASNIPKRGRGAS